jgi:hypothetical protein
MIHCDGLLFGAIWKLLLEKIEERLKTTSEYYYKARRKTWIDPCYYELWSEEFSEKSLSKRALEVERGQTALIFLSFR